MKIALTQSTFELEKCSFLNGSEFCQVGTIIRVLVRSEPSVPPLLDTFLNCHLSMGREGVVGKVIIEEFFLFAIVLFQKMWIIFKV